MPNGSRGEMQVTIQMGTKIGLHHHFDFPHDVVTLSRIQASAFRAIQDRDLMPVDILG